MFVIERAQFSSTSVPEIVCVCVCVCVCLIGKIFFVLPSFKRKLRYMLEKRKRCLVYSYDRIILFLC